MPNGFPDALTYQELKSHSATMGLVLFKIKYNKPVERIERSIALGISICDAIKRVTSLTTGGPITFEDLTAGEAFSRLTDRGKNFPGQLASMEQEADMVREILESIGSGDHVSADDLEQSASFFNRVYAAT